MNMLCQCPTSGFSHFYPPQRMQRPKGLPDKAHDYNPDWMQVCQCPTSGFSHFYFT